MRTSLHILRRLTVYVSIGVAVLVLTRALVGPPQLTVPAAVAVMERHKQDEWILLDQAHRLEWATTDPVIFSHLVRSMKDIGEEGPPRKLFDRAVELNLHRHDPIVRERLLDRARRAMSKVPADRMPSTEALQRFLQERPQAFVEEGAVRFAQVFYKDESTAHQRQAALRNSLQTDALEPAALLAEGEPLLGLRPIQSAPFSKLELRFGEEYRNTLEACPLETLCGPARSVYGVHYFYVLEKTEASVPPFEDIEHKVRTAYLHEAETEMFRERLVRLRKRYGL